MHLHAIVSGDVQGVGFRAHTSRIARSLGITGWVRNREDGSVEVVAEGAENCSSGITCLVTAWTFNRRSGKS